MTPPSISVERDDCDDHQPTLVLLHHFGGSARTWQPFIACIGDRRRCIALDLPGFGRQAGHPGPYTVAAMADHVAAQILDIGLNTYSLVGHSMGGKVALALAARCPAGLRSLTLLAPSPPTAEPIDPAQRMMLLAAWGAKPALAKIVDDVVVRTLSADLRAILLEDMLSVSREAWSGWLLFGSREDIAASMAQINVPVLVVSGDSDTAIPIAIIGTELLPRLADAALAVITGAGHLLPLEATAEITRLVLQALNAPVSRAKDQTSGLAQ